MTAHDQMAAMRAAVQAELPVLARELRLMATQGFHDGGRFREIAAAMTEIPAEVRLSTVIAEINRAALEAVAGSRQGTEPEVKQDGVPVWFVRIGAEIVKVHIRRAGETEEQAMERLVFRQGLRSMKAAKKWGYSVLAGTATAAAAGRALCENCAPHGLCMKRQAICAFTGGVATQLQAGDGVADDQGDMDPDLMEAMRRYQERAKADKQPQGLPAGRGYTVERHGNGWAIYLGRDTQHHGANLGQLTECGAELPAQIQAALNASPQQPQAEPVGEVEQTHPMMGSGFMHTFTCKHRLEAGTKLYAAAPQTEDAADAYHHACELLAAWQAKRVAAGLDPGCEGSLCDGLARLFAMIDQAANPDTVAAAWEVKDADGSVSFAQKRVHAEPFVGAPGYTVRPLVYGDVPSTCAAPNSEDEPCPHESWEASPCGPGQESRRCVDCRAYLGIYPVGAPQPPAAAKPGRIDPSWTLHDRVEFALRDAGFDLDEASHIAALAAAFGRDTGQ